MATSLRKADKAAEYLCEQLDIHTSWLFVGGDIARQRPQVKKIVIGCQPLLSYGSVDLWGERHGTEDLTRKHVEWMVAAELLAWHVDERGANRSTESVLRLWYDNVPVEIHLCEHHDQRGIMETRLTSPRGWWSDVELLLENRLMRVTEDYLVIPHGVRHGFPGADGSRNFMERIGLGWIDPKDRKAL